MEPLQNQVQEEKARAKEIDSGTYPLSMENVILGLPYKPNSTILDQGSVSAQKWTYGDLVSQRKLITTLSVSSANYANSELWSFTNSWHNVHNTHFRTLQDLFLAKSWTLNFEFEFRSNFQQVGMFCVSYCNVPKRLIPYLYTPYFYFYNQQCMLPHRNVFAGEDQNLKISLKWNSPLKASLSDYYAGESSTGSHPNADDYDMGWIMLTNPAPIQVAQGVDNTMTIRIWSWLSDIEYAGYYPTDLRL